MKIAIGIVSALVVIWIVVIFFFGAQLNTVYLCHHMENVLEHEPEGLSGQEKQQYYAEQISRVVYSQSLRRLFSAMAELTGDQRQEILKDGLVEIMGDGYTCTALEKFFAPPELDEDY